MRFRTGSVFTAAAVISALVPAVAAARTDGATGDTTHVPFVRTAGAVPVATTGGRGPGTAWGNTCASNITNDSGSPMFWRAESNWSTDTWNTDPSGTMIDNLQSGGSADDLGGFARGCHDEVDWVLDDGVTVSIQNTDPYTGGNSFSCVTSKPSEYQCTLDSSSVIHGPILLTNWTVNKIS